MPARRLRAIPELDERDLSVCPLVALSALISLFEHLEVYRPLLPEELSTLSVLQEVRDGRNQLLEERFGRGSTHPVFSQRRRQGDLGLDSGQDDPDEQSGRRTDR